MARPRAPLYRPPVRAEARAQGGIHMSSCHASSASERLSDSLHSGIDSARSLFMGPKNVGEVERAVSLGAGAALIVGGLKHRSLPGLLFAGLGAALAWRGVSGRCPAYSAAGLD